MDPVADDVALRLGQGIAKGHFGGGDFLEREAGLRTSGADRGSVLTALAGGFEGCEVEAGGWGLRVVTGDAVLLDKLERRWLFRGGCLCDSG